MGEKGRLQVRPADLERSRKDVGEEQHLLVGERFRNLVDRGVCERDPRAVGLQTVDQMSEDPTAAARAEPVTARSDGWATTSRLRRPGPW